MRIGASIGIALFPDDGTSREALAKHADLAMYQAKESGKNNFQFFRPEMNSKAVQRLSLIHDLHKAVEEHAFQLHYQPLIRLTDRQLIGMEALIRWPRGNGGNGGSGGNGGEGRMVPPLDFIPCAEETGLIIPMGGWVLDEACRRTAQWNRRFDTRLRVAVNLSARQFRAHDIFDEVMGTLRRHDLAPELLELEITESILMDDVEEAIAVMGRLREAGVSIAIDDFGTGYSSLSHLKRFPITILKIDHSFVRDIPRDVNDIAIVHSILSLAGSLGLGVVAEGVESETQLELLRAERCQLAQGYHIARPMSAEAFERYLGETTGPPATAP